MLVIKNYLLENSCSKNNFKGKQKVEQRCGGEFKQGLKGRVIFKLLQSSRQKKRFFVISVFLFLRRKLEDCCVIRMQVVMFNKF